MTAQQEQERRAIAVLKLAAGPSVINLDDQDLEDLSVVLRGSDDNLLCVCGSWECWGECKKEWA